MKEHDPSPPKFLGWLLTRFASKIDRYSLIDDLEEEYGQIRSKRGRFLSLLWYWQQIFKSIPTVLLYSTYRSGVMAKNYSLIALRNIRKRKVFSFINIVGLAIGLSLCLLVIKMVFGMYESDRFHTNKNRIYRVISTYTKDGRMSEFATAPLPITVELTRFPEVESVVRMKKNFGGVAVFGEKGLVIHGLYADKDFFHVFSFDLEKGDRQTALSEPYSIVISEEVAKKFFSERDPIGEVLSIKEIGDFKITGVLASTSKLHSHMSFECLASAATLVSLESQKKIYPCLENWQNLNDNYVYFMLHKDASPNRLRELFVDIARTHYTDGEKTCTFEVQPLTKISPGRNLGNWISSPPVAKEEPFLFSCIALVIMLIACFNYTNLSLAKSLSRAREAGIRKVIGASRFKLFTQFIGEAVTYSLIALAVSYILLMFIVPEFSNQLRERFDLGSYNLVLVCASVLFAFLTGVLGGFLPALYMSRFNPTAVLKDITKIRVFSKLTFRRALVVFQFFISFIFIITTLVFYRQIQFEKNYDLGFHPQNILIVELQEVDYSTFRQEIFNHPSIRSVAGMGFIPNTGTRWIDKAKLPDSADFFEIDILPMDEYYTKNIGLELLAGHNFPEHSITDDEKFVLINETAALQLGLGSPDRAIGKLLIFEKDIPLEIIGVVKDFVSSNISKQARPLALRVMPDEIRYASIQVDAMDNDSTLLFIEEKWKKLQPFRPIELMFFEDHIKEILASVEEILRSIGLVTFLTILIAFFGLLGMVIYDTEARIKEIGIRKVMGASVWDLVREVSKGFVLLLSLAAVLATPLAWFLNNMMLQNMANHVPLGVGIFVEGTFFMFGIGLLIIFSQTLRAAYANPVDSLRYE